MKAIFASIMAVALMALVQPAEAKNGHANSSARAQAQHRLNAVHLKGQQRAAAQRAVNSSIRNSRLLAPKNHPNSNKVHRRGHH